MSQLFPVNAVMWDTKLTTEQQEKIMFAMSIDFEPLRYYIIEQLGVHVDITLLEVKLVRGDVFINFETSSVLSGAGFFGNLLKECVAASFGNGVRSDTLDDFVTEELRYWVSVNLQYVHLDGGKNGFNIANAQYTENKGWTYSPARKVSED